MSQQESLNEDAVFTAISKSSPDFYHCERERHAMEILLRAGPGAFYTQLNEENLEPFLSPQEVTQLSTQVQDYSSCASVLEVEEDKVKDDSGVLDFSVQYWPLHSDIPVPSLELGWPHRDVWVGKDSVNIYISPPAPQAPPVREVVRRLIQEAQKVVAVVTDRLTDNTVISDLCDTASKGVPVYIILDHRFTQESNISQRLKHENIRVRMLGGKSFCSRDGKMVTGELKENFLLVDVEKVMTGSYSLTWADAHLHRQLVMVLTGPVVEWFDQEFRILYAASLPIPKTWVAGELHVKEEAVPFEYAETHSQMHLSLKSSSRSMSPSPSESFHDWEVDWDELGVTKYHCTSDKNVSQLGELLELEHHLPTLAEIQKVVEENSVPSCKDPRLDNGKTSSKEEEIWYRAHFASSPSNATERLTCNLSNNKNEFASEVKYQSLSSNLKKEDGRTQLSFTPKNNIVPRPESRPGAEPVTSFKSNKSLPKKPLILRVSVAEKGSSSAMDDFLKKPQSHRSSLAEPGRSERIALSKISKSMQDLSHFDEKSSAHQSRASSYNFMRETPALTLMRRRTVEIKSGACRHTRSFLSVSRAHMSNISFLQDWKEPTWAMDQGTEEK